MSDILQTIKTLTEINSPSGNAEKAIQYVKQTVEDIGYSTELTNKGALIINVEEIIKSSNDVLQHMLIR